MIPTRRTFDQRPDSDAAVALLDEFRVPPPGLGPTPVDRPLALYGAGALGRMAWTCFQTVGIPVSLVIDANADALAADPFWRACPPVRPDQVTDAQRHAMLLAVCIVTTAYVPLAKTLADQGWQTIVPVYDITEAYRDRHPLSNGWFAPAPTADDLTAIAGVLRRLGDDLSRAHHLQTLAWRYRREEWVFPGGPADLASRFFIPEVMRALSPTPRFLDLGAHTGPVCARLLDLVGDRCRFIWAVEPDAEHLSALRDMLSQRAVPHQVFSTPVADRAGPGHFRAGLGFASQLSPDGAAVSVTTVDALDLNPDFIKLHLEGGELAALRGATATLARTSPVIAATSYHNAEGLHALPTWMMDSCPNHRVLIRLHGWCGTGAVVYALPQP